MRRDIASGTTTSEAWYPWTLPALWLWSRDPNCPFERRQFAVTSLYHRSPKMARTWLGKELESNPACSFVAPQQWSSLGFDTADSVRPWIRRALNGLRAEDPEAQFNGTFLCSLAATKQYSSLVQDEVLKYMQACDRPRARQLVESLDAWNTELGFDSQPERDQYERVERQLVPLGGRSGSLAWDEPSDVERLRSHPSMATTDAERLALLHNDMGLDQNNPETSVFLHDCLSRPAVRVAAAAELWHEGDEAALDVLRTACEGDFQDLCTISDYVALDEVAMRFPQSRFTRACHEYGMIRGHSYFYPLGADAPAPRPYPPAVEEAQWRSWLARYPHHPGADDAGYWVGRCLEWQGRRQEALTQYADLLAHMPGDGDMQEPIWQRFLVMLDAGAQDADLDAFVAAHPTHAMVNAVNYARAVRMARHQRFTAALALAGQVHFSGTLLNMAREYQSAGFILRQVDDQYRRWAELAAFEDVSKAANRLRLAYNWSVSDGYKIGYLGLYAGNRAETLTYGTVADAQCPWLGQGYRDANAAVIAMRLVHPLTEAGAYRADALAIEIHCLGSLTVYPQHEADIMVPLPGFPPADPRLFSPTAKDVAWEASDLWCIRQAHALAEAMLEAYPGTKATSRAVAEVAELEGDDWIYRMPGAEAERSLNPSQWLEMALGHPWTGFTW
jgi:hypothetical protein